MRPRSGFWIGFAVRRLVRLALLLPAVAVVSFVLVAASPVDPVAAYVGAAALRTGPEQRANIARHWGLDDPPVTRLAKWAGNVASGDLGTSTVYAEPVAAVLKQRFRASILLLVTAWLIAGGVGYALGLLGAVFERRWPDRLIGLAALALASAPTFWIGILLISGLAVGLRWFPACCAGPPGTPLAEVTPGEALRHLVLPALALACPGTAQVALHTRAKMRDVMASPYALLGFAQGLSRARVAWRHGVRNAALPAITLQFAHVGELFGGSILAEEVFGYPGLGQATVEAGTRNDVPLLLGIALVAALFVFTGNTLADLLFRAVDPRLRSAS